MSSLAPISDRLGKLIRMLSSDRDGEVLAAAKALNRTLQSAGADLHVLAAVIEKPTKLSPAEMRQIYDAGFKDGLRKAENAQHGPADFRNIDGSPCWNEIALWCQQRNEKLNEKERKFIDDMAGLTVWREPTEKQAQWLKSIFYRLGGPK
jgi:hypothetical protein